MFLIYLPIIGIIDLGTQGSRLDCKGQLGWKAWALQLDRYISPERALSSQAKLQDIPEGLKIKKMPIRNIFDYPWIWWVRRECVTTLVTGLGMISSTKMPQALENIFDILKIAFYIENKHCIPNKGVVLWVLLESNANTCWQIFRELWIISSRNIIITHQITLTCPLKPCAKLRKRCLIDQFDWFLV